MVFTREHIMAEIAKRNQQINTFNGFDAQIAREVSIREVGTEINIDEEKAREVDSRPVQKPREVYKEEKKKRSKDSSRIDCEELENAASNDAELASSHSLSVSSSLPSQSLRSELAQNSLTSLHSLEVNRESFSQSGPQELSSRVITGISAQHNITASGVKVSISIQTNEDHEDCTYREITAELKASDRLRELKPYAGDSEEFAEGYATALDGLKKMKARDRKGMCVGRVHERGKRSAWIADTLVIGRLDSAGELETLEVHIESQLFTIAMNKESMSPRQKTMYHTTGTYGQMVLKSSQAPSLWSLPKKRFNG